MILATRSQKIQAAQRQASSTELAVAAYFRSNFKDDGVRVFVLARAERARRELQRVQESA